MKNSFIFLFAAFFVIVAAITTVTVVFVNNYENDQYNRCLQEWGEGDLAYCKCNYILNNDTICY